MPPKLVGFRFSSNLNRRLIIKILLFFVSDHLSAEPKAVGSAVLNAKYCRKIKGKSLLNDKIE